MTAYERGQWILHRHFVGAKLVWAPVVAVAGDDERGLRLWMPTGVPVVREVTLDGESPRDMPFAEWLTKPKHLVEDVYGGPSILKLLPPGASSAVWWLFRPDGGFAAWYGNLEEPAVRWSGGVDTTDQDLDIWVWPDRSWSWKDEDDFEERIGFPEHYWVGDPEPVRAEGRRLIKLIEAGEFPFDGTWCDFRPDPAWSPPPDRMPDGWDRERAR